MNNLIRKIRRWSSRTPILAIRDDDLEEWLNTLGVLESFRSGEVGCFVCKKSLDLYSLQMVGQVHNKVVFCCSESNCIIMFSKLVKGN